VTVNEDLVSVHITSNTYELKHKTNHVQCRLKRRQRRSWKF